MAAGSSEGSLHSLEVVIEVVGPNVSVCGILLRFGVSLWESFLMRVKIPRTLEVVFEGFEIYCRLELKIRELDGVTECKAARKTPGCEPFELLVN